MAGKPGPVALYMSISPRKYARNAVRVALDNGTLTRGACARESANCRGGIEAHHHHGYNAAQWLDVVWLCRRHHAIAHSEEKAKVCA